MLSSIRLSAARRALFLLLFGFLQAFAFSGLATAATTTVTGAFNFAHAGSVSTGLVSIGGTFTNPTTTTAPTITLTQFNPTLGRLTGVTVTASTSTATFAVAPSGLLSLLSSASATRRLTFAVTAGATSGGDYNEVTTTGSALLTLLSLGGGEIGGAPLSKSVPYTTPSDLARFSGTGTVSVNVTAIDTLTVFSLVSVLNGAGITGSGTYAGSVSVSYQYTPWAISGYVYKDIDHDGFRGPTEGGTGMTLYAKLLSGTNGPALQAVSIDPATGSYGFTAANGAYRIVIDDNATLSDVTPLQPPGGWSATQSASLYRDVTVAGDLASQDFGLTQATTLAGRLFVDDGRGGGLANDGAVNGGEAPLPGKTVQLLDAGGGLLDAAVTGTDGSYRLFVPASVGNGSPLRIRQGVDPATIATGASVGNTGGSFDRAARSIAFGYASNTNYAGVNFGSIPVPSLGADASRTAPASTTVLYTHRYTAPSAGQLTFSTSHVGPAGMPNWSEVVYVDGNANDRIDPGESPATTPISVVAGQVVAVIVKVSIPANSPPALKFQTVLQASIALTNAAPALTQSVTVTDWTAVATSAAGSVALFKSVDRTSGEPGTSVTYTIAFANLGATPVSDLVVNDETPAYTTFQSLGTVKTPGGMQAPVALTPAAGAAGALQWTFTGQLMPNASGSVQFTVLLDP